jgi:hypothetical protein
MRETVQGAKEAVMGVGMNLKKTISGRPTVSAQVMQ